MIRAFGRDQAIWEKPFEDESKDGQGGDGPRATPTVDDGLVYVLGGFGQLLCVTADKGEAGIKIVRSHLKVTVSGLDGMTAEQFAETAKAAEGGCPVSNALRGSLAITLDAMVV